MAISSSLQQGFQRETGSRPSLKCNFSNRCFFPALASPPPLVTQTKCVWNWKAGTVGHPLTQEEPSDTEAVILPCCLLHTAGKTGNLLLPAPRRPHPKRFPLASSKKDLTSKVSKAFPPGRCQTKIANELGLQGRTLLLYKRQLHPFLRNSSCSTSCKQVSANYILCAKPWAEIGFYIVQWLEKKKVKRRKFHETWKLRKSQISAPINKLYGCKARLILSDVLPAASLPGGQSGVLATEPGIFTTQPSQKRCKGPGPEFSTEQALSWEASDRAHRPGLARLSLWGKQTTHQQASLLRPTSLLCFLASSQIHLAHFNLNMLTLFLQHDHLCLPFRKMIVLLVVWKSCFMADEYSSVRKSTHLAVSRRHLCTSVLCPYLKFYMSLTKEKCEPFIFHLLVLCSMIF